MRRETATRVSPTECFGQGLPHEVLWVQCMCREFLPLLEGGSDPGRALHHAPAEVGTAVFDYIEANYHRTPPTQHQRRNISPEAFQGTTSRLKMHEERWTNIGPANAGDDSPDGGGASARRRIGVGCHCGLWIQSHHDLQVAEAALRPGLGIKALRSTKATGRLRSLTPT